ncbi:hypothetical protein [Kribbella catacumbae]|uniref:hypothetical protein n=1 Tax=Kribbella catacumbae TaxID=460086 RepID=UPI000365406C|nr:hypothetical protein [Kribbella catacumbae]
MRKRHSFRAVRKLNKVLKTLTTNPKMTHSGGEVRLGAPHDNIDVASDRDLSALNELARSGGPRWTARGSR